VYVDNIFHSILSINPRRLPILDEGRCPGMCRFVLLAWHLLLASKLNLGLISLYVSI